MVENVGHWIISNTLGIEKLCSDYSTFRIPSFQRGYEWDAYNVQRLVRSVYEGAEEQTFLGAIQIAIDRGGSKQIVDGRQRLTTLALFYAIYCRNLNRPCTSSLMRILDDPVLAEVLANIQNANLDDWVLSTIGSKGDVTRLTRSGKEEAAKKENIYLRNACYINTLLRKANAYKDFRNKDIERMFSTVFFIAVEIKDRELTQVIRIFDTLNSTGQPLSDEAMFKIRYHSYLQEKGGDSELVMASINEAYAKVDGYNHKAHEKDLVTIPMPDVLWAFRTFLILRKGKGFFASDEMALGTLGFFENLFGKENLNEEDVSLKVFHVFVDYYLEFYERCYSGGLDSKVSNGQEAVDHILVDLLMLTRYRSSWAVPIAAYICYRFVGQNEVEAYQNAMKRCRCLYQVLLFFSLVYQKAIKGVRTTFLLNVLENILEGDAEALFQNEIKKADENRGRSYRSFWDCARKDLYDSPNQAYALLTVLEAKEAIDQGKPFSDFISGVFPWQKGKKKPQIEHIFARDHFQNDGRLSKDEKAEFNGLGNFVLLEERINKGANKNGKPSKKFSESFFVDSAFASVAALCALYEKHREEGLDNAQNWLSVIIRPRFEELKGTLQTFFPLLKVIQ